jgi:hypothetical protein
MTTIIVNQAVTVAVTLLTDGTAVPIAAGSTVTAQLFDISTGAALFTPATSLASTDAGSSWPDGLLAVPLTAPNTANVAPPDAMLVIVVNGKVYRFRLLVELANAAPTKSALFVRDFVIADIRADQLIAVAQNLLPGVTLSDDYIWRKVLAAEGEISHQLRVDLQPTQYFPRTPTDAQIAALGTMPWKEDPAYDYDPEMFQGDKWGFTDVRRSPVISVQEMRYAYPSDEQFTYTIPLDWLKIDKKYGQIRVVPTSNGSLALLNSYLLQLLGAGRIIPHMINLTYVAGLANASRDFPELLDAVKKIAVLKMIEDAFVPQSGSISADGLSESISVDVGKYHESVDRILNGDKGGNGGLMTAIHGIRMTVI